MSTIRLIAETAFRLHEEKHISRDVLVDVLQDCVNITALENGYADKHGLPFPVARDREIPPRFKSGHLAPYRSPRSSTDSIADPVSCKHDVPWTACTTCSKSRVL